MVGFHHFHPCKTCCFGFPDIYIYIYLENPKWRSTYIACTADAQELLETMQKYLKVKFGSVHKEYRMKSRDVPLYRSAVCSDVLSAIDIHHKCKHVFFRNLEFVC